MSMFWSKSSYNCYTAILTILEILHKNKKYEYIAIYVNEVDTINEYMCLCMHIKHYGEISQERKCCTKLKLLNSA